MVHLHAVVRLRSDGVVLEAQHFQVWQLRQVIHLGNVSHLCKPSVCQWMPCSSTSLMASCHRVLSTSAHSHVLA